MDERGIKVYEYNADSASCHTEGGLILEEWVKNGYRGSGHNPAEGLLEELTGAWKHSHARPFVHIMQDNDVEEDYHALFIQRSLMQYTVSRFIKSVYFQHMQEAETDQLPDYPTFRTGDIKSAVRYRIPLHWRNDAGAANPLFLINMTEIYGPSIFARM